MPIFAYTDLDKVIEEINNRDKPLVVYHFSEDSSKIDKVQNETSSGAFVVNDAVTQMLNLYLPFGGVGKSGYGRFHGETGLKAFSNPKSICKTKAINSFPLSVRFPPYSEKSEKMVTTLMAFGNITYGQLYTGIFLVVLLIAAIVCASIFIPA
jgi:aldehyde dehydrogenase (NAD+)